MLYLLILPIMVLQEHRAGDAPICAMAQITMKYQPSHVRRLKYQRFCDYIPAIGLARPRLLGQANSSDTDTSWHRGREGRSLFTATSRGGIGMGRLLLGPLPSW